MKIRILNMQLLSGLKAIAAKVGLINVQPNWKSQFRAANEKHIQKIWSITHVVRELNEEIFIVIMRKSTIELI